MVMHELCIDIAGKASRTETCSCKGGDVGCNNIYWGSQVRHRY